MSDGEGWEGTKGNWFSSARGDREEGQLAAPGHRARQRQRLSDEIQAEFANVFGSRRAAVAAPKPPASVTLPLGSSFQVPMASVPESSPRPSSWPLNSTCPVRRGRSGSPPHLQVWPTPIAAGRDRRHQSIPGSRLGHPRGPTSKGMSHWNASPATAVSRSPHAARPTVGDDDWGLIDADPAAQAAEISHRASKTESAPRLQPGAGHGDRRRHRIQTYALPMRHRVIRFKTATSQRINATCNTGCLAGGLENVPLQAVDRLDIEGDVPGEGVDRCADNRLAPGYGRWAPCPPPWYANCRPNDHRAAAAAERSSVRNPH